MNIHKEAFVADVVIQPQPAFYEQDIVQGSVSSLLYMLDALTEELHMNAACYEIKKEQTLWLLFPGSFFYLQDLLQEYAGLLKNIQQSYTIRIHGSTPDGDTAMISLSSQKQHVFSLYNITRSEFDALYDICFELQVDKPDQLELLKACIQQQTGKRIFSIHRKWAENADIASMLIPETMTCFCYLTYDLRKRYTPMELIASLDVDQITELWISYFETDHCWMEFTYALEKLKTERHMILWELALHQAFSILNMKVDYEKGMQITQEKGRSIRIDYGSSIDAQKLIAKLLFPMSS